ncbi:MAG: RidA family protein [Reichenbachiella sp.]
MIKKRISSGSTFESKIGYSRAVVDDHYVHVSGTTGYNYDTMSISEDVVEQTEQCLLNIKSALEEAGSSFEKIVRINYILLVREDFELCWPVLQKYLGDIRPAATMIVAGLADEAMKIEIQVTAGL